MGMERRRESERRRGRSASLSEREVLMRNPSHSSPFYIPGLHEREAGRRTLIPSLRFYNEMTPECRVSPIPLSLIRERIASSSLPAQTISFLAPPLPSNSLGLQQKSTCLGKTEKSSQPKKLKLNLATTSTTTLKPISTTPVRRSFKSTVEEVAMMMEKEAEMLDNDEVFIKDLDLNVVHKLSLRDMPFLPAFFCSVPKQK